MPGSSKLLRPARTATIFCLCLAAAVLSAFDGQAQICELQIDQPSGGIIDGKTSAGLAFDPELEIEIAPDLSTVRLENSIIRVVYKTLSVPPEYAINSFVIKSADEDQLAGGSGFMDAGFGLGPLESSHDDRGSSRSEDRPARVVP